MIDPLLRLKDKILDNAVMFNLVRMFTDSRSHNLNMIKKALNLRKNDKMLDVGCGLGNFSKVTDGKYIGIDMNPSFIKFAKKHYSTKSKKFMVADATKLEFKNKSFDKSMFISMLHHFPNNDADKALKEIQRVTKDYLVVLDLLPSDRMLVKFMYAMDRGSNIRPIEAQKKLIKKYFRIVKYKRFDASMSVHSLMVCRPLK